MSVDGQPRSRARARTSMVLLIPVLIVVSACSSAAGSSASPPSTDAAARAATTVASGAGPGVPAGTPIDAVIGAPAQAGGGTGTTGTATGSGGTASNAAIAYPYPGYPGPSGVAPDHTIVVTGVGNAAVKADGSNRSSAQRTALGTALADAKAQADLVAQATGVTIKGVLSVSVTSGQMYAYPLMAGLEGSSPGVAPGGTTVTPPAPAIVQPAAPQLEVSVTVAYQIG